MNKGIKIGIGIGVAVVLLIGVGITGYFANENLKVNEELQSNLPISNIKQIGTEEEANAKIDTGSDSNQEIIISEISYKVTGISVSKSFPPFWEKEQGEYMLILLTVENLGNEPSSELSGSDFLLIDSKNRRYDTYFYDNRQGTIQPGLGGSRGLLFLLPFDKDLDYTLKLKDNTIQLGNARDFHVDVEIITSIAIKNQDISVCDILEDNTECIVKYAEQFNQPEKCDQADNLVNCFKAVSLTFGWQYCRSIQDEASFIDCVDRYFRHAASVPSYYIAINSPDFEECRKEGNYFSYRDSACRLMLLPLQDVSEEEMLSWKSADGKPVICNALDPLTRADDCMGILGVYWEDTSLCDLAGKLHEDSGATSECYTTLAYVMNDVKLCEKVDEVNRQNCINQVNRRNT